MNGYDPRSPAFLPRFCPNPNCCHHKGFTDRRSFKKAGFFVRRLAPRRVQRFTCLSCRRSFSSQTFSCTYWLKRPDIPRLLFTKTTACMSNRQIARDVGAAPETVNRHIARLGRHCLLYHARMMRHAPPPRAIVIDGFVTFEWSQYYPFHHHLAVECGTDFFLYFNDSEVRRSGTMTARQKQRRIELEERHGRPDPRAVRRDVARLLRVVVGRQSDVIVHSDDHRAYPPAIRDATVDVVHRVTSSRAYRGIRNPLWEVNLLDLLIRHGGANHKRETIAWSKRRQGSAERLAIFLVWRNYMNRRRAKDRASPTPAMARRMCDRRLTPGDVLAERIFPSRQGLPPDWRDYYRRRVMTRPLQRQRQHVLTYAI